MKRLRKYLPVINCVAIAVFAIWMLAGRPIKQQAPDGGIAWFRPPAPIGLRSPIEGDFAFTGILSADTITPYTAGAALDFYPSAAGNAYFFRNATSGENPELRIWGYKTGIAAYYSSISSDSSGNMYFTQDANGIGFIFNGVVAVGPGVFTSLSNILIGRAEPGIDNSLTFYGQDSTGVLRWMEDEDYFKFQDSVVFAGTAGLPHAECHQADGGTFNVTATDSNTWYEVDAATTNITATELNLCTFPDDHYILCTVAGKYFVSYSFTGEINSVAGGDQHVESGIMVNGSIQTDKGTGHEQYAATNKERNLQGHTIIDVPENGQISLAIKNTTSSGKVLTIDHVNITVNQLGGT